MFRQRTQPGFNLEDYLKRIGYTGSKEVTVDTLMQISIAHSRAIPFENLAMHEEKNQHNPKQYICLDIDSIFHKLVRQKRGGHCIETNELLMFALVELGFQVDRLMGRSFRAANLPRGHKTLMVTIDDKKWIADVGFGGHGLLEPIPFLLDTEFNQSGYLFRVVQNAGAHVLQYFEENTWKGLMEFSLDICKAVDFHDFAYSISHNPENFFKTNRVCAMAIPGGKIILHNYDFKILMSGKEEKRKLKDESEYMKYLKQYFGIAFPHVTNLIPIVAVNHANDEDDKHNTQVQSNYHAGDLHQFNRFK